MKTWPHEFHDDSKALKNHVNKNADKKYPGDPFGPLNEWSFGKETMILIYFNRDFCNQHSPGDYFVEWSLRDLQGFLLPK